MPSPRCRHPRRGARFLAGLGVAAALSSAVPLGTVDAEYPPSETMAPSPPTTRVTGGVAATGADGVDSTLTTGLAFGVAGLGMLAVARRRRQPTG